MAVLNRGATRDKFQADCLREITFLAATHEFGIKARHLPGLENRVADLLSRWEQVGDPRKTLEDLTGGVELVEESIDESAFKFSFVW